jgi:hypothetical protein
LFDICGAVLFLTIAVVTVMRGVRRGDASRDTRAKGGFWVLLAITSMRGLFPDHSWRVSAGYFAALLVVGLMAVWEYRPRSSDR